MRILYITAECVPGNTGGSVHAYEVATHLAKHGHDVTVLCHRGKSQSAAEDVHGAHIIRSPMRVLGKAFSPKALIHLPLLRGTFDVVMERFYATSFLGAYFSRIKKAPLVLEVNNPHLEELKEKKDFPSYLMPAAKLFSRMTFAKSSLIFTPLKNCVPENVRHKVREISWAVNTNVFHPGSRHEEKCLAVQKKYNLQNKWVAVYAGTFRTWQCPDVLVDAAEIVSKQRSDFRLLFVGSGDIFDEVKLKIQQKNLNDVCVLAGEQPYENVPYFLGAARLGLAPFSLTKTMQRTGFYYSPLKIFEYMSCGLPVVTSSFPHWSGIVTENETGFLLPQNWTPQDMARIILKCMDSQDMIDVMGRKARQNVESGFSWDAHVGTLLKEMILLAEQKKKNEIRFAC